MDSYPDPPHLQEKNGNWNERKVLIRWPGWAKHSLGHHSRCCVLERLGLSARALGSKRRVLGKLA